MKRRLAAILAADVVGYSRLMGEDENGTLVALRQLRAELFAPAVAGHRGKVIKNMGDGWLVEFSSTVDAVNCALRIQDKLIDSDIIKLRIGVHIGDIVHENEDIFGDGVNIAARLQEVAAPGSVVISDPTYGSLDGTLTPSFDDGGQRDLKNIRRPVHVWSRGQIDVSTSTHQQSEIAPTDSSALPTLTIIPISVMDERPELRDLADALTYDLATYLNASEWLLTAIREQPETQEFVFLANLRSMKNRLRLEVKLSTSNNEQVWADKFDGNLEDSFDWQDEVGEAVAASVVEQIADFERQKLSAKAPEELLAEECLFLAIADVNSTDVGENLRNSLNLISMAIDKDPGLERAYVSGLAWLGAAISMGYKNQIGEYLPFLPAWREKAESQTTGAKTNPMSGVALEKDAATRFREIEQQLRRAAFDPTTLSASGAQYIFLGEPQLALECLNKARRLGLTSLADSAHDGLVAIARVMLEDYDGAIVSAQKALQKYPSQLPALRALAAATAHLNRMKEAADAVSMVLEQFPEECIFDMRNRSGYVDNPAVNRYLDGLRLAGLPD